MIFPGGIFFWLFFNSVLYRFHRGSPRPSFPSAARCHFPLGLGSFSVEQDEPPCPDFTAKVRDRWIWRCLLPVDVLLGTREEQRGRNREWGAKTRRLVGWKSWNHLEKAFFAGRARTKGDGRRDAMTTFGGFPGNRGHHGNCITPVGISDFRWKACSPL